MTKELRQTSEKLQGAADATRALAVQMAELLKLREAVKKAEEAHEEAKQRSREFIPRAGRRT